MNIVNEVKTVTAQDVDNNMEQYLDEEKNLIITEESQNLCKAYGLDFHIEKLPMTVQFEGKTHESDYFGLLNCSTGEVINSVKETYHVSQNNVLVELARIGMVDFRNLRVVKMGHLNGGRKVFIQLSIEGDGIVGNDTVKRFVTLLDSNDGTASLSVGIGDKTMSCSNQYFQFYKVGDSKFRHSKNMKERILEIPNLIIFALERSMRMTRIYNQFEQTPCTKALVLGMVETLLDTETLKKRMIAKMIKNGQEVPSVVEITGKAKTNMDELVRNIDLEMNGGIIDGENYEGKGQNLWGLFSGVTRWTTHTKSAPKRVGSDGRLESIMSGTNYVFNQKALDFSIQSLNKRLKRENVSLVEL